jgi:hypothetical protein
VIALPYGIKSDYTNRFRIAFAVSLFQSAPFSLIFVCVCVCQTHIIISRTKSYSLRLSVAINNRLPKSFITNLLTKFIFNFPSAFAACYSIASHPLQIY